MLFSMVSTCFQATLGTDLDGSTGDDTFTQCLCAILRVLLLSATFVLGQRAFKARNSQKPWHSVQSVKNSPRKSSAHGRPQKKSSFPLPSEDDGDVSTSAGSSDSESEAFSSDNDEGDTNAPKIGISALLQCRPAAGPAPIGSLRAMAVAVFPVVSRQQFEQRRWDNLRSCAGTQQPSVPTKSISKIQKTVPSNKSEKSDSKPLKSDSKLSRKAAPLPKKSVACAPVDPLKTAANAARMQALLEIICPEDVPVVHKEKAKGALPPWRQPAVATMPLSLPPGLEVN